jgi:hypothetical protein
VRKLGIEPGEGRLFFWGAVALALTGWADVSLKNVAETLFNKRVGVAYLPLAYLLNSLLLVGTTYIVGRVAARSNRSRLLPRIFFGLSVLLLPLWYLVGEDATSAFVLLVLASKQFQSVALLAFWLAIGDHLDGRQAKRLFAPIDGRVHARQHRRELCVRSDRPRDRNRRTAPGCCSCVCAQRLSHASAGAGRAEEPRPGILG